MGPALESPGFNPPLRQITPHPRWRKEPEKKCSTFFVPISFPSKQAENQAAAVSSQSSLNVLL